MTPHRTDQTMLGIYLNDHLAGATSGVELIRRISRVHQGTPAGDTLRRCADEIAEDRETLIELMGLLGVPTRHYKVYAGWLAEKAGRFKANGRVLARSPLSGLIELETMTLGVEGKAALWRTLRHLADHDDRLDAARLDALLDRARQQADDLEELRVNACLGALRHP